MLYYHYGHFHGWDSFIISLFSVTNCWSSMSCITQELWSFCQNLDQSNLQTRIFSVLIAEQWKSLLCNNSYHASHCSFFFLMPKTIATVNQGKSTCWISFLTLSLSLGKLTGAGVPDGSSTFCLESSPWGHADVAAAQVSHGGMA